MSDSNAPSGDEAFREERVQITRYDRGIRDDGSDGAVEARREHRERLTYDDNARPLPARSASCAGRRSPRARTHDCGLTAGGYTRRARSSS
jgi:hypothetical protein